eukprot:TRINITY_DN844_c0_g1_i1.p1 TRINITY_DN844_c0_g1~~TRINITY_DN844_c0_g1_i1.p1  ORF type:complete len:627 (+),score=179.82 TRINITY_DN844_c0_g1_i1:51-1931(+)
MVLEGTMTNGNGNGNGMRPVRRNGKHQRKEFVGDSGISVKGDKDDLNEFLDLSRFGESAALVYGSLVATLEQLMWCAVRLFVLVLMRPAGILLDVVYSPLVALRYAELRLFENQEDATVEDLNSAVNLNAGDLLNDYRPDYKHLDSLLVTQGHTGKPATIGDVDLATFFAILSSSVYESNKLHGAMFSAWGFPRSKQVRILTTNSCSATIVHKVVDGKLVLFIIFKGTCPFNINEWMSDLDIDRVNTYLPALKYGVHVDGELHGGFSKALTTPSDRQSDSESPMDIILLEVADIIHQYRESLPGGPDRFNAAEHLRVWITGHSLGAALATVFTSFVVAATQINNAEDRKNAGSLPELGAGLCGVYTFGNPKVGNRRFAAHVNRLLQTLRIPFYRVRNGNDIVGAVPPGTGLIKETFTDLDVLEDLEKNGRPAFKSLTDYGEIGIEFRLSYFGTYTVREPIPPYTLPEFTESISEDTVILFERTYRHCSARVKKYAYDIGLTVLNFFLSWVALIIAMCRLSIPDVVRTAISAATVTVLYFAGTCIIEPVEDTVHYLFPRYLPKSKSQRQLLQRHLRKRLSPLDALVYRTSLLTLGTMFVMPSVGYDHIPGEYVKHLHMIKLAQSAKN